MKLCLFYQNQFTVTIKPIQVNYLKKLSTIVVTGKMVNLFRQQKLPRDALQKHTIARIHLEHKWRFLLMKHIGMERIDTMFYSLLMAHSMFNQIPMFFSKNFSCRTRSVVDNWPSIQLYANFIRVIFRALLSKIS